MNYQQNAVQGSRNAGMAAQDRLASPTPIEKPRIAAQVEHLQRLLSDCHASITSIEHSTDRLIGAVPQGESTGSEKDRIDSLERRIADLIQSAEGLSVRLQNASQRLNAAV